ncbi:MAG: hypothetical protein KY429_00570 [Actinobacteria bacterium]|nr:hypothetical protein [Actinomycetota bacterium]
MDWLEFIASLVESLAWPIVVVLILILFRNPVTDLIPLVRRIKYKDLELEFERTLAEATQKAQREQLPITRPSLAERYDENLTRLVWVAEVSPRAAILEAWLEVEASAAEAAVRFGLRLEPRDRPSPLRLGSLLAGAGVFSQGLLDVYNELRDLRNKAVHAVDISLSPAVVRDYVSLALSLVEYLRNQRPSN